MSTGHERVVVGRVGAEVLAFPLNAVREVIDAHRSVLDGGVLLGIQGDVTAAGIALVFAEEFALRLDDAAIFDRPALTTRALATLREHSNV